MKMNKSLLCLALSLSLCSVALAQKPSKPALKAAETITSGNLREFLSFIASDALQGRDTPSPGLDSAAEFMGFFLRRWGFEPGGGDQTFYQKIPLTRTILDDEKSTLKSGDQVIAPGTGFALISESGLGEASAEALLLRVSTAKPADTDLTGKILVVIGQRREFDPIAYARRNGAVALVRLATGTQDSWLQFQQQTARFRGFSRGMRPDTGERKFPAAELSPDAAAKLLESAPTTQDTPTPLGKTLSLSVLGQVETAKTQNVVAIWPGTDPTLKAEYVALGAHYDHVGVRTGGTGDQIFNGADDDGSGTVSLLAMCEALARNKVKLKRSLIFVWHCGEEKGLWGSEFFTNKPTVPIDKIITQLNIDMVGRSKQSGDANPRNANLSGPNGIYVIGSRKLSTQLGELVDGVNGNFLKIEFDYRYDDPADPNRFYFRSDHYNYARKGIPIAFWFDGVHEDYHRASDEVSKIDFTKIEKIARTVFITASVLADAPTRPKVDKPIE